MRVSKDRVVLSWSTVVASCVLNFRRMEACFCSFVCVCPVLTESRKIVERASAFFR